MNKYESVIIINPNCTEEALKALESKFTGLINENGKVESYQNTGKKRLAYDQCFSEAVNSGDPYTFRICSHNTFSFTCAWDSKDGVRYSTAQNDYLIKGATL